MDIMKMNSIIKYLPLLLEYEYTLHIFLDIFYPRWKIPFLQSHCLMFVWAYKLRPVQVTTITNQWNSTIFLFITKHIKIMPPDISVPPGANEVDSSSVLMICWLLQVPKWTHKAKSTWRQNQWWLQSRLWKRSKSSIEEWKPNDWRHPLSNAFKGRCVMAEKEASFYLCNAFFNRRWKRVGWWHDVLAKISSKTWVGGRQEEAF